MIDSVESVQQALDEFIAREGPSASLMHLLDTTEDEDVQISDFEGQEEEGSSGSPVSVAEVCMAGTPPPQPPPSAEYVARNDGERAKVTQNVVGQEGTTWELIRRPSSFRRLELRGASRGPHQMTREEQEE